MMRMIYLSEDTRGRCGTSPLNFTHDIPHVDTYQDERRGADLPGIDSRCAIME